MQLHKASLWSPTHPGARVRDAPAVGDIPPFVWLPAAPSFVRVLHSGFLPVRQESPGREKDVLQRREGTRKRGCRPLPVERRPAEGMSIFFRRCELRRRNLVDIDTSTDDDAEVCELVQRLEAGDDRVLHDTASAITNEPERA